MNISRAIILGLTLIASLASGQTSNREKLKGTTRTEPGAAAASPSAAALANVNLVKGADGSWKCMGAGGKICTSQEAQAYVTVTKSLSNIKNNLSIAPDGTVRCTAADGKPCTDAAMQQTTTQMKAITKGGQQNY